MKHFIEAFGWFGVVAIVGAYALLSFSVIASDSIAYQALNIVGSLGIVTEALTKRDYQPAVLNIIWLLVGAIALARIILA